MTQTISNRAYALLVLDALRTDLEQLPDVMEKQLELHETLSTYLDDKHLAAILESIAHDLGASMARGAFLAGLAFDASQLFQRVLAGGDE